MYFKLEQVIDQINFEEISTERKDSLHVLIDYIQKNKKQGSPIRLNFVCTHNSRRSQFSQIWAAVAAAHFQVAIESFSSGVEVTEFNENAVASLTRFGFKIDGNDSENPLYQIQYGEEFPAIEAFSKLLEDTVNPSENFAAIMTCTHADENCPFVPGCAQRISLPFDDPKTYDGTPLESAMYDYRSFQIATEMFYVFSRIQ